MISAVFDCGVFLQAAINDTGPAHACLAHVETGDVKVWLSDEVLAEVRETLSQPKIRAKFPHLTDERTSAFISHVTRLGTCIQAPAVFALPRDPDDAKYVDLAIAAAAAFLVSRDNDLLSLMNDEGFRKAHPGLTVIDPVGFLRHVRIDVAQRLGYE
jgi:putative PIN family toxin of toxin-antitoxin system